MFFSTCSPGGVCARVRDREGADRPTRHLQLFTSCKKTSATSLAASSATSRTRHPPQAVALIRMVVVRAAVPSSSSMARAWDRVAVASQAAAAAKSRRAMGHRPALAAATPAATSAAAPAARARESGEVTEMEATVAGLGRRSRGLVRGLEWGDGCGGMGLRTGRRAGRNGWRGGGERNHDLASSGLFPFSF